MKLTNFLARQISCRWCHRHARRLCTWCRRPVCTKHSHFKTTQVNPREAICISDCGPVQRKIA